MKKRFKIAGYILLGFTAVLAGLYFYIVNNAEDIIRELVRRQSHGKFSLTIEKIRFNPKRLHLLLVNPHFYSNDSVTQASTYDIKAQTLVLELSALKPLIYERKIMLDTIVCMRPQITVTKWKDQVKESFSLPEQMGKVYNGLDDMLKKLNVNYCLVDSGSLTLKNNVQKNQQPVTITDYYLRIDNFKNTTTGSREDSRYLHTDRIKFYSSHQKIVFPSGNHGIQYSRLRINSQMRSIEIDSCYIYSKKTGSDFGEVGVFFDTLRLSDVDFAKITQENLIKADSAICINPDIRVRVEMNGKRTPRTIRQHLVSKDSMEFVVKSLVGDLDINYIGVLNAGILFQTKSNNKVVSYNSRRNNFVIKDVVILKNPDIPLHVGSIYLGLEQFQTYDADSLYSISFDSVLLKSRKVELSNFAIAPTAKNKNTVNRKEIRMPTLEINQISWLDLILNKQIVAEEISMISPEIRLTLPGKNKKDSVENRSVFELFGKISNQIKVNRLQIKNANLNIFSAGKNHLVLNHVNTTVELSDLLNAEKPGDLTATIDLISFEGGSFKNDGISLEMKKGVIDGKDQQIHISEAVLLFNHGTSKANIKGINIGQFNYLLSGIAKIKNLSWASAEINLKTGARKKTEREPKTATDPKFQLEVDHIVGGNTQLKIQAGTTSAEAEIVQLSSSNIKWSPQSKPSMNDFHLIGKRSLIQKEGLIINTGEFVFADQQSSYFSGLTFSLLGAKQEIFVTTEKLSFKPNLIALLNGNTELDDIIIQQPNFALIAHENAVLANKLPRQPVKLPVMRINQITINNPVISTIPGLKAATIDVAHLQSVWKIQGINISQQTLKVDQISSALSNFQIQTPKVNLVAPIGGYLHFTLANLLFKPAAIESSPEWSALVKLIEGKDLQLNTKNKDSSDLQVNIQSISLSDFPIANGEKMSAEAILNRKGSFKVHDISAGLQTQSHSFQVYGMSYQHKTEQIQFDSLSVKPRLSLDSFLMANPLWQKNYIDFQTSTTTIAGFNWTAYFRDTVIQIKTLVSQKSVLNIFKDKRLPLQFIKYKPLPTAMIQGINKKIKVDSIILNDARITYEEINDKTKKKGKVFFYHTNAVVEGFKTFDYQPLDSLRLTATSRLLDTARLRLKFNESYTDTLHGFLIAIRLSPFYLDALNPMLEPFASAKINRGFLDTLRLTAVGREYVAYGKIKMYYQHLNATYLKNGEEQKSTIKTRLITFFANSLILRKNNQDRIGQVYTERIREKGIFHYWVKMVLSGVITSTGARSNKKQHKKYIKSLKNLHVPEIPEFDL